MPHVSDLERRARIARRHGLAPAHRYAGPEAATAAMTVLHATEPATVHLSLQARVDALTVADVEAALHDQRSLVRQLAMRRTMFVFPRELLPAALGSASARTAAAERARMVKDVVRAGLADDGERWVDEAGVAVLGALADEPDGLTSVEIRERVPSIAVKVEVSAGAFWGYSRVLTLLGATGDIVRGPNTQHWRVFRPRWRLMADWLGELPRPVSPQEGYAALVRRWLWTFGPGTEADLVWWLGATKGIVRTALADVSAVEVSLDGGAAGWLLPDDLDPEPAPEPWAALLPVLDPTVMGWKERAFYLGGHGPALFDRNGNAGTTAWWDGRVVGCWVQDAGGEVRVVCLEDVGRAGRAALEAEAARLSAWLDGVRVGTVYPSPAMKSALP